MSTTTCLDQIMSKTKRPDWEARSKQCRRIQPQKPQSRHIEKGPPSKVSIWQNVGHHQRTGRKRWRNKKVKMKTSLTSYVLPNLTSKSNRKSNCNYQSLIKRILLLHQVHQADAAAKKERNKELKHPNKIKRESNCKINLQLAIILVRQLKGHEQAQ